MSASTWKHGDALASVKAAFARVFRFVWEVLVGDDKTAGVATAAGLAEARRAAILRLASRAQGVDDAELYAALGARTALERRDVGAAVDSLLFWVRIVRVQGVLYAGRVALGAELASEGCGP